MNSKDLLKQAINLEPVDRFIIIEGLLNSLDNPDMTIDEIWLKESEKRLEAYRNGKIAGVPYDTVFADIK